jgi:hypothetical protein
MAHSPHRRRKGCPVCKPHKHRGHGDSVRQPVQVMRQVGKTRRWNRHDVEE